MRTDRISKDASKFRKPPNMDDYRSLYRDFSWDAAKSLLSLFPDGSYNIAREALDRHALGKNAEKIAICWLGIEGERRTITYRDLKHQADRFAGALQSLKMDIGDRVFLLLDRIPELYSAFFGALEAGCVVCPLFSAFGPDPIATRLELGEGALLVTTEDQYTSKIEKIRDRLPELKHILLVGENGPTNVKNTYDYHTQLQKQPELFETMPMLADDPALLHFTSGTTGKPKGALHAHHAVLAHTATGKYALDLHEDDIFWCTADPGWVTGISYGIIAPLSNGVTMIVDQADFEIERWYEIIQKEKVTVWYTSPTALRMMMKAGAAAARACDLSSLRLIFSVGEPLNPEAVVWGLEAFGLPIHDTWWQTETGAIMISNYASQEIRPGSMGLPFPGVNVRLIRRSGEKLEFIDKIGEEGEIAIQAGWPSMFRTYINSAEKYRGCFQNGWYFTGDLAKRDADGYFWFVGRSDDVIKSSGHLIGPFEVESAMMEHPAVAEAAVIGKPDEMAGQIVKAFLSLRKGFDASPVLKEEIYAFGRKRLGAVAPREIDFMDSLPKTRSGKIMRRLLKARELGLPEGDTSTLEASR